MLAARQKTSADALKGAEAACALAGEDNRNAADKRKRQEAKSSDGQVRSSEGQAKRPVA